MKKQIIITKLFETGGSNSSLKTMLNYWGREKVLIIVESEAECKLIDKIDADGVAIKVIKNLHGTARLEYRLSTNVKEIILIIRSILICFALSAINGFPGITISAVEPERHIYLFWMPFLKVRYFLHSTPSQACRFTIDTCKKRLGKRKNIIAVSHFLKETINKQWQLSTSKNRHVHVVYNSLKPSFTIREKSFSNQSFCVLTIGRVGDDKNPSTWFDVAKKITDKRPDVNFIWVGSGPDLQLYQKLTKHNDQIKFPGLIDDVSLYLSSAALYYQPSIYETHGIAVVEAMASALPCVVSNRGGLPESVIDNFNGLVVDPLNIEQNIKAIGALLDNKDQRMTYAKHSKERFLTTFDYSIYKNKMDDIYR